MTTAKHGPAWAGAVALLACITQRDADAQLRFSELLFNPPGVPVGRESIELLNTNNGPINLFGFSIVVIDGEQGSAGTLVETYNIPSSTTIPAGGHLLIRDTNTTLQPPPAATTTLLIHDFSADLGGSSRTFILGFGTTPPVGIDVDLNDDGVLDVNAVSTYHVVDAVAIIDHLHPGDVGYADDLGFTNVGPFLGPSPAPHTPIALYRFFNADHSPCSWAGGEVIGSGPGPFAFDTSANTVFGLAEEGVTSLSANLGNTNLLPDLNGNGIANACDSTLVFAGLPHGKLGSAVMSIAGDSLLLQNVGASGADGVAVALGKVESHVLSVTTSGSAALATGASISFVTIGSLANADNQTLTTLNLTDTGPEFEVTIDATPVSPASLRVVALLGGSTVDSVDLPGPVPPTQTLASLAATKMRVRPFFKALGASPLACRAAIELPSPQVLTVVGGAGAVIADELRVIALSPATPVGLISATRVLGRDLVTFTIDGESVGDFQHDHTTTGASLLLGNGADLAVLGLGASGQDGVTVDLIGLRAGIHVGVAPIDLSQPGRRLDVAFRGTLAGGTEQPLVTAAVASVAGGLDLTVDATPASPCSVDVVVYDQAEEVGSINLPAAPGTVATVSSSGGLPVSILDFGVTPPVAPGFDLGFSSQVVVTPAGGAPLVGDRVRVELIGLPVAIDGVSGFDALGTQLAGITLNCESGYNVTSFGHGCPGTGGSIPRLRVTGCPQAKQKVTLEIDRALGGSVAFVFVGVTPAELPLAAGCTLNVFPIVALIPVFVGGPGPGLGAAKFSVTVPESAATADVVLQAFNLDLLANLIGATSTNGVLLHIDP